MRLKIFKKKTLYIILIFILLLSVIFYLLFLSRVFKIDEFEIIGVEDSELSRIHNSLDDHVLNKNLILLNEDDVNYSLDSNLPSYMLIKVKKTLPSKIELELKQRDDKYLVENPYGCYIIDSTYYVLEYTQTCPKEKSVSVYYEHDIDVGRIIEDRTLINAFKYSEIDELVKVIDNEIIIELDSGGKVILPEESDKSVEELVKILQKLLKKYTIENRKIVEIDLRFAKPLVKF